MSNIPLNVNTVDWDVTASKVIGRLNSNLIFDVSGTSNIIFRSNNFNRLLITDTSNIDISGTAMRFRGDFSNASAVNRCLIQSSVTNGNTAVGIVPNGTSTTSQLVLYNTKDTLTSGALVINQTASSANILTNNTSGGVPTSLNIGTGGLSAISIDTSQICSFSILPTCTATPTSSTQLTTKTYVDNVGTFTTYTPSNTNVTVGNGTQTARYSIVGKTVFLSYRLVFGSTTSFGNPVAIGLPFTSNSFSAGLCYMTDIGVTNYTAQVVIDPAATQTLPRPMSISGSYPRYDAALNSTTPFTWGTGDILAFSVTYESV